MKFAKKIRKHKKSVQKSVQKIAIRNVKCKKCLNCGIKISKKEFDEQEGVCKRCNRNRSGLRHDTIRIRAPWL